jgi:1,4-alpha-glucan branching enzyme
MTATIFSGASVTVTPAALPADALTRILEGRHVDPHSVLGLHPHVDGTYSTIRVYQPTAKSVTVLVADERTELTELVDGFFVGVVAHGPVEYLLEVHTDQGTRVVDDPYRWMPTIGEIDLHLMGVRSYATLHGEVTGVSFAVWAPNAQGVQVTGNFDDWDGRATALRNLNTSGIWEIFVPGLENGTKYKFRMYGRDGQWHEKADPMAFATEQPPATASVVHDSAYHWADKPWLAERVGKQWWQEPMSIYEVHLGSWRRGLSYVELAEQLVDYVSELGFTHVELLPVAEHPFGGSWGYQVTSYYAPTSRFGSPDEFRFFVDRLHAAGIGVIVDWVPAHFPRDNWALARFDGEPCYEHPDPKKGEHPDWGTFIFDFGRTQVRNFLVANALFWIEEFHIDGLRVDAVASMLYLDYSRGEGQWIPNVHGGRENLDAVAFLQEVNATVYKKHPDALMIAEESTAWPGVTQPTHLGGLGFGFKWNMGWMHDTLRYLSHDPVHRSFHHNELTFSLMYAWSENFLLPLSHDEVVHGKCSLWSKFPGDDWAKAAGLRSLLAYMWAHPGKQLLFMGGEFGQVQEWSEGRSLDWDLLADGQHGGVKQLVSDMNQLYKANPAFYSLDNTPDGFAWIDANDSAGNVLSFIRTGRDGDGSSVVVCIANFSGAGHADYRVGLPFGGRWKEVLNTDATYYGGSGVGNLGVVTATDKPWHARPASVVLQLPPNGVLWLIPE